VSTFSRKVSVVVHRDLLKDAVPALKEQNGKKSALRKPEGLGGSIPPKFPGKNAGPDEAGKGDSSERKGGNSSARG